MPTTTTLRCELAAAVRAVGAAYGRLPEDRRPNVEWGTVDELLEAALLEGEREMGLAAIRNWRDHHLRLFEEAAK